MAEEELDPLELARQLRKPTGEVGGQVALKMNDVNRSLYELGWSMIDMKAIGHLLEIGFGNGKHFSWYFEQNPDMRVTGVDISEDMCEMAGAFNGEHLEDNRLEIYCASSDNLPLEDGTVDLVFCCNTIYFQTPPEPHLEEIVRVLKPGGRLMIGYRPPSSFQNLPFPKDDFTLYEPEQLRNLLELNDFEIAGEERKTFDMIFDEEEGKTVELTDICVMAKKG